MAVIACVTLLFTACEKHDGEFWFKAKCVASLNGQEYIDQTPLKYLFLAEITPRIKIFRE